MVGRAVLPGNAELVVTVRRQAETHVRRAAAFGGLEGIHLGQVGLRGLDQRRYRRQEGLGFGAVPEAQEKHRKMVPYMGFDDIRLQVVKNRDRFRWSLFPRKRRAQIYRHQISPSDICTPRTPRPPTPPRVRHVVLAQVLRMTPAISCRLSPGSLDRCIHWAVWVMPFRRPGEPSCDYPVLSPRKPRKSAPARSTARAACRSTPCGNSTASTPGSRPGPRR